MTATERWHLEKWGKFSASNMDDLLTVAKGGSGFGKEAMKYIMDVASQAVCNFSDEEMFETFSMKMGKANEPNAFALYYRLIGLDSMEYYGGDNPIFRPYCPDSGCSPDAVAYTKDGMASFGAQFKCPQRKEHFHNLVEIGDDIDLKNKRREHYTQCQFEMECYGCDLWHFVSFNENFIEKKIHIIEVRRDETFIRILKEKLDAAIEMKYKFIEQLKN